jgi:hypothetical protein
LNLCFCFEAGKGGFHEVYQKALFKCYRRVGEDDEPQEVEVEILDAGPEVNKRYRCTARIYKDGIVKKKAGGNAASTIDAVLFGVHWDELD